MITNSTHRSEIVSLRREATSTLKTYGRGLQRLRALSSSTVQWLLARWYCVPGSYFQRYRLALAASALAKQGSTSPTALRLILHDVLSPTCYFDFDFAWKALRPRDTLKAYLDMSSPWLFPILLLRKQRFETARLLCHPMNLAATRSLLLAASIDTTAQSICTHTETMSLQPESFDVITSLGRLGSAEHDTTMLRRLWSALKPGGDLIISVLCAREAEEQFLSALPNRSSEIAGDVFVRRFYDAQLLRERIFNVIGEPRSTVVYGETTFAQKSTARAFREPCNSLWRDSLTVGRHWRCYSSVSDLPADGIIAMKFSKFHPATPEMSETTSTVSL